MEVSIIIVNFNTFQLTCKCIQSVLEHTKGLTYEIILVDNASTECAPDLFKQQFPSLRLIKSKTNLGFAGGNNLGLACARGQFILLLNSDTLLIENSIQFIYRKSRNIPNLGAATIRLVYPDGKVQHSAQKFPSLTAHFLFTTRLNKLFKKKYQNKAGERDFSRDFTCDWIWGTFFFFPARHLPGNKKLSETYFMYAEDLEWCYHFKKAGLTNYYFSGSKIIHFGGKSSSDQYKKTLMLRNNLHFIKEHFGRFHYMFERLLLKIDTLERVIRSPKKNSKVMNGRTLIAQNKI